MPADSVEFSHSRLIVNKQVIVPDSLYSAVTLIVDSGIAFERLIPVLFVFVEQYYLTLIVAVHTALIPIVLLKYRLAVKHSPHRPAFYIRSAVPVPPELPKPAETVSILLALVIIEQVNSG